MYFSLVTGGYQSSSPVWLRSYSLIPTWPVQNSKIIVMWLQILSIIQINHFKHHLINILFMKIKKRWVSMFFNQGLIFLSNYEARDTKTLCSAHIHIQLLFSSLVQSNCLCVCLLERTCSLHNTNIKQWLTGTLIHIPTYILVINKNTI